MAKPFDHDPTSAAAAPDLDEMPGLCRVCGRTVPRPSDPTSCTTSLCSEECLARAIVAYWAALGSQARVSLQDGFARLESLPGVLPSA